MRHVATARLSSTRSDIESRLTGRFYTPLSIAAELAQAATSTNVGCPESVCDPFCGDGRLVVAWLQSQGALGSLRRLKRLAVWDFDPNAVASATLAVAAELNRQGLSGVAIESWAGDTFGRASDERFELVLTNPPWEQLKPDSRDAVGDAGRYRVEIREYAAEIAKRYPEAAASRKRTIGGYTVNLARAGALAAVQLTAESGQLLIVLPSTIFADQVSSDFRRRFFSDAAVQAIDVYPAEARLFAGVDQSFVTVRARVGQPTSSYCIRRFLPDSKVGEVREHSTGSPEEALPLAIGGAEHALIGTLQERHPSLQWLESDLRFGLRLGREIDETRIADAFADHSTGIPFVKGRDISRFCFAPTDLPQVDARKRKVPPSAFERRVVWRDVSRPSQKRRIHACLMPEGFVTGNSLGIARFASPQPYLLETLLALMNSLVFEIQVRGRLATNHVSQGVVRSCVAPYALFEDASLREKIGRLTANGAVSIEAELVLETMIAKTYGLHRDEFATLLQSFNKLAPGEVDALVSKEFWS